MNCKKFKTILNEYLDGLASREDKKLMEKHLHDCHDCSKEYHAFKNIKKMLSLLEKQHAQADLEAIVTGKIKDNAFPPNPLEAFIATAKTTLAAAVLLFAIITAFSFFTPSMAAHHDIDNVEAINNYVLKGNAFAKKDKISDAKIIEALLG